MEKLVDLHIHTTASDGTLSPRACVAMARELGLAAMAVTDHDTAAGLPEALAAGAELGMPVVPGVELAADWRGRSVHILGLFIDPASPGLRPALDWAVEQRERRNEKILAAMAGDGLPIRREELGQERPGAVLGRPHIAAWLMEHGYAASVADAFDRYLGRGKKYYFPRQRMPLTEAVGCIRAAGGVAVMAHPLQYGYGPAALEEYLLAGRAAGCGALEAYYSEHSAEQTRQLLATAERLGLAVSGGSDFHGARKPHIAMGSGIGGSLAVPASVLEGLRRKL